jgi:F0F1-type ATP synthase epsilon subunit
VSKALRLRVWSPAETVLDVVGVQWVHLELNQARPLTIWPGHAPLLAETTAESLRYGDEMGIHVVSLSPGMLQVREDEVLILVGGAALHRTEDQGGDDLERLTHALLADLASQ